MEDTLLENVTGLSELESTLKPQQKASVRVRSDAEEDGKYLLYEAERESLLLVNGTGKEILALCDGTRSIAEICDSLKSCLSVPPDVDLNEEVSRFLFILSRANIVTFV